MRTPVLAAALVAALTLAAPTAADNPELVGTVGPAFAISLVDASGKDVTHLDPGTYTIVVHDRAAIHNFHLSGPGVDTGTDVEFVGDKTFTVTFVDGNYVFQCDPHPTDMQGRFTVGTPPPPPPPKPAPAPKAIAARVGPGPVLAFPARLAAGRYAITVRDATATDNLHLRGPGVNRRTGVAFRGTATWTLTLAAGRYRVWSDAHPKRARSVTVF